MEYTFLKAINNRIGDVCVCVFVWLVCFFLPLTLPMLITSIARDTPPCDANQSVFFITHHRIMSIVMHTILVMEKFPFLSSLLHTPIFCYLFQIFYFGELLPPPPPSDAAPPHSLIRLIGCFGVSVCMFVCLFVFVE